MKRVGLSRFSPLEVSRKVQQCLRFEGVSTNGVSDSEGDFCPGVGKETADVDIGDTVLCDKPPSGPRGNILTTIKKKLRKPKRNKRSDLCPCRNENCELDGSCPKHLKLRKQKCGGDKNAWPVPSSILRCHNRQISRSEDVAELISNLAEESTDDCDFLVPPSEDTDCCEVEGEPSTSSLLLVASSSLSDITCLVDPSPGLPPKVESESDVHDLFILDSAESSPPSPICPSASDNNNVVNCVASETVTASPVVARVGNLTTELQKLSKHGWYWGPITRSEAESKLVDQPDGAFLVRDSSDDRYILSLSFRSYRKTFHTRIEHSSGLFSFYSQPEPGGHASIIELIQQSMCLSQSGVFCYSRSRSPGAPSIPVRLTKPVSRFTQVRTLQYLCRFVIRQYTRYDHLQKLPLPPRIKGYLEEGHY